MTARSGILIILAITAWRILLLAFDGTDLFVDEAQYWFWSQNLDFGYYSKPPMIAWVLGAVTWLAGSSDIFFIRIGGPLIHMATALVLMAVAGRHVDRTIAGWVGVAFVTAPAAALSSILFSTDVILLFFIAVTLWAYFGLTKGPNGGLAVLMGLAFGCAFLSKYAVLFLLPGGLAALALVPQARLGWRDFFIAAVVAAAVAAPNLWWNLTHDITTVRHTQDIAHWNGLGIDIAGGTEFFLAQFGVVGPVLFVAMLWGVWRMVSGRSDPLERILVWLSMPVVALITLQAFVAKAYANWAVAAYAAGMILAVWVLHQSWRRGLWISLAINGLVSVMLPLAPVLALDLALPNGRLLLDRYLGRSDISRRTASLARAADLGIIVSDSRDILADLYYSLRNEPFRIYARPPAGFPKNYYEQKFALDANVGDVLFVTRMPPACPGNNPELLERWEPQLGYYRNKPVFFYRTNATCLAATR